MKKAMNLIVLLAVATCAMAQQEFEMMHHQSFKVEPLWFHITSDSTVEVVPCQGNCLPLPSEVEVPAYVSDGTRTYKVTRLGEKSFAGLGAGATQVTLPETLEELGAACFHGSRIPSLTLPNSLRRIEYAAFHNSMLTSLHIPASVDSIQEGAFASSHITTYSVDENNGHYRVVDGLLYTADTTLLLTTPRNYAGVEGSLVLPSAVRRIGDYALTAVSTQMSSLTLPEGLREIGISGLGNYSWAVELPASVVRLDSNPVKKRPVVPFNLTVHPDNSHYRVDDGQLMSMDGDTLFLVMLPQGQNKYTVPDGVKVLVQDLFYDWGRDVDSVLLPEGLEEIGACAFQQSYIAVNFPSTLKRIGSQAFDLNRGLAEVVLPDGLQEIGPWAFYGSQITSVVLPDGLEVISREAFCSCSFLTSVTWGSHLREIHPEAFGGCRRLQSVPPLPRSLRSVGYQALYFSYPSPIDCLVFEGTPEAIGEIAVSAPKVRFGEGNPPTLYTDALEIADTVYVPCGMAETYRRAVLDGWGDRFTYLEDCDGIEDAEESGLTLALQGRDLRMDGTAGQPVRVLDAVGRTLFSGSAPATVRLPASGLYLVHSPGKKAVKVAAIH